MRGRGEVEDEVVSGWVSLADCEKRMGGGVLARRRRGKWMLGRCAVGLKIKQVHSVCKWIHGGARGEWEIQWVMSPWKMGDGL